MPTFIDKSRDILENKVDLGNAATPLSTIALLLGAGVWALLAIAVNLEDVSAELQAWRDSHE